MSDNLALDDEGFSIFVSEIQELLSCITSGVKQPCEDIELIGLQRHTHTLKGVLAVYALDAAVAACHAMEDVIEKVQQRKKSPTKMERLRLQKHTQKMGKQIVTGLRKLSNQLPKNSPAKKEKAFIKQDNIPVLIPIPNPDKASNEELEIPTLYDKVDPPANTVMAPILKKYLDTADVLARKLGKKIDIHFSGGEVPLPQKGMTLCFASMLHLIRNAVDHGVEKSAKRLATGKTERGSLRIMARRYRGMFIFCIADDGAGIDCRRVKNLAIRQGLINKQEAARSSQADLLNLIFLPGFSLKKHVNEISGRGIGMDAVKYAVESHQGRMDIKTELGKGTMMKIMIPYQ